MDPRNDGTSRATTGPRRRALGAALVLVGTGAALLRLAVSPAAGSPPAQVPGPALRVEPSSAAPGQTVRLVADGFLPGSCVGTLLWDGEMWDSFKIQEGGAMDVRFVVPPGSLLGEHRLTLQSGPPCLTDTNEFGLSATADLRVTAIAAAAMPRPDLVADQADNVPIVVVRALFDGRDRVVSQTVTVSESVLPARAVQPELLRLTARDVNGEVVDQVPGWHPTWVDEWTGDGEHHHLAQARAEGRFLVPLRRNLGLLEVMDAPRQAVVAQIDLQGAVTAYCDQHPDVAACVPPGPSLWLVPAAGTVKATQVMTLELRARDIKRLYGAQLTLRFDPRLVEVVDLDDATPGVQVEPGDFPAPDAVLRNNADNDAGTLEYVATLQGPKPGVSGGGTVATAVLRGKAAGSSPLSFERVVLSDPESRPIAVTSLGGELTVTALQPEDLTTTVSGQVVLERRSNSGGARVCVETHCVTTGADGAYTLADVLPRTVRVTHPSYLSSERAIPPGQAGVTLPPVTLLGGDVNQDGLVYTQDIVALGGGWNQTPLDPRWREPLDITDDDIVDVLDAVAVEFNLGRRAPGPWPAPGAAGSVVGSVPGSGGPDAGASRSRPAADSGGADDTSTVVMLAPESVRVPGRGVPATLDVVVRDVTRLFGFNVMVKYDRTMLRVIDANPRPSAPGVQVRVGDFLDLNNLLVAVNRADDEEGLVYLMVTQTYPAPGRTGSGVLGSIDFEVLEVGTSRVKFEVVELYDDAWPDAQPIATAHQGADVTALSDRFLMLLPWMEK
jgi:hypothetical protein